MMTRREQIIAEMRRYSKEWWFKDFNSEQGVNIQYRTTISDSIKMYWYASLWAELTMISQIPHKDIWDKLTKLLEM